MLRASFVLLAATWFLGITMPRSSMYAQIIPAVDPLPVETQLFMHMLALQNSWEVVLAHSNGSTVGTFLMPDDVKLKSQLTAVGEQFRFDLYPRVKDFIHFFTNKEKSGRYFGAVLGMSHAYKSAIDRILHQQNLPEVLHFLPIALSGMNVSAVSEHGAAGLWQMNYHVAIRYGLHCSEAVDERRDIYRSTQAALTYMADLHKLYGDWLMALTAYVCGPAGLNRAQARSGSKTDFNLIYPHLPNASRDYVPAFIAAAFLAQYESSLGLSHLTIQQGLSLDRIQLQAPLGFKPVADVLRLPEIHLRQLNPVCRLEYVPGLNMPVQLCLPKGYGAKFAELQDSIYRVHERLEKQKKEAEMVVINNGNDGPEMAEDPADGGAVKPGEEDKAAKWTAPAGTVATKYVIKSGDVLGKIAQDHGVTVSQIMAANQLRSHNIKAGETLTIYVPKSKAAPAPVKPNPAQTPKPITPTTPKPATPAASSSFVWYTVKSGDNLWTISRKYPGVTDKEIMELNGISEKIQPGLKLKIPVKKP